MAFLSLSNFDFTRNIQCSINLMYLYTVGLLTPASLASSEMDRSWFLYRA